MEVIISILQISCEDEMIQYLIQAFRVMPGTESVIYKCYCYYYYYYSIETLLFNKGDTFPQCIFKCSALL